jgi:hypothetical protein
MPFLHSDKWDILNNGFIGTPMKAKQVIVYHKELKVKLRFLDLMMYAPGDNLRGLVKAFGDKRQKMEKGFFPYDILDITIPGVGNRQEEILVELNNILCKNQPFAQEDFHNDLTQEPFTDDNYKIYLQESEKFATRWDYLEGYNIKDVEIMITPINNLMNMFQDLGMDMFHSISLSSNANAVKHKMLYEDFDVNENYDVETDDPYFIPTMQWAKAKVEAYNEQDEKANEKIKKSKGTKLRDVSKNITAEQLSEFCKKKIKCYMCHVAFTAKNKPTLDRVDNSKGHSLDNIEACCLYCNRVKSDNDKGIVHFKI